MNEGRQYMGAVEMNRGGGFWDKGSYISTIEKCVYCDKCGSFRISKFPTFRTLLWSTLAAIIAILFSRSDNTNPMFVGILCFLFLSWMLSAAGAFSIGYVCQKCWNFHITMSNKLNYPKNGRSVLDTTYQRAVKIYVASDNDDE
jgi:hypothetical protein